MNAQRVKVVFILFLMTNLFLCGLSYSADFINVEYEDASVQKFSNDQVVEINTALALENELIGIPADTLPPTVCVFDDSSIFEATEKEKNGGKIESHSGFFDLASKKIYVLRNNHVLQTIQHEYAHYLIRLNTASVPKWLNEGLAESFEGIVVQDGKPLIQAQEAKLLRVQRFKAGVGISLKGLLIINDDDWGLLNRTHDKLASSVAWSFCFYLLQNPDRKKIISRLLTEAASGSPDWNTALKQSTGKTVEELDFDWKAFLDRMAPSDPPGRPVNK